MSAAGISPEARTPLTPLNARRLLAHCDGTRNRTALAAVTRDPARGLAGDAAGRFVTHGLEQFARLALLIS